jgi:hypothetical protein
MNEVKYLHTKKKKKVIYSSSTRAQPHLSI